MQRVSKFATRIQIDISDGIFAPNQTINLAQVYWSDKLVVDLHMMVNRPDDYLHEYIALSPNMVIIHAEANEGALNKYDLSNHLHQLGIKFGLGLLGPTSVQSNRELIELADHVLIFTGNLGHYGGQMDMKILEKIKEVKNIKPSIEIGIDGGVNQKTALKALEAGADVLNVGGFIQQSANPQGAYAILQRIAQEYIHQD
jgi:ribulose-phosphate 3-epimerase